MMTSTNYRLSILKFISKTSLIRTHKAEGQETMEAPDWIPEIVFSKLDQSSLATVAHTCCEDEEIRTAAYVS
jgi:hypothetical protein